MSSGKQWPWKRRTRSRSLNEVEEILKPYKSKSSSDEDHGQYEEIDNQDYAQYEEIEDSPKLKRTQLGNLFPFPSKAKKKRRPNTKIRQEMEDRVNPRRVGCYCTCKQFKMNPLRQHLRKQYHLERFREVLHFQTTDTKTNETGNVFVFPYGVLIFWNLSIKEELSLVLSTQPYSDQPLADTATDHFDYYYWEQPPKVLNDQFFLCLADQARDEKVKVAMSHGIAQSIKLSVFEEDIDVLIDDTKRFPVELARLGKISLTGIDIFKKMGKLWVQKNEVNLHSDILDTPEFFFENPSLLPLFAATIDYFDLEQRVNVLNSRLDVVGDMYNLLNGEVHSQHGTRLEWIVIWVIIVDVLLDLLNLALEGYHIFFVK